MRSGVPRFVMIVVWVAVAGVVASLVAFGPNMIVGFTASAAALVALIAVVSAPWLPARSGRADAAVSVIALGVEVIAALLLLTSPPSNSHLWVPINIARFGGLIVAGLGLVLTLYAADLRHLGRRQVALLAANGLAIAIGIVFAGWENRR